MSSDGTRVVRQLPALETFDSPDVLSFPVGLTLTDAPPRQLQITHG